LEVHSGYNVLGWLCYSPVIDSFSWLLFLFFYVSLYKHSYLILCGAIRYLFICVYFVHDIPSDGFVVSTYNECIIRYGDTFQIWWMA